MRGAGALAALIAAGWAAACAPGGAPNGSPGAEVAPDAAACAAAPAELAAGARVERLAGEFRLTVVAESGPRAGGAVAGTLRLHPYAAGAGPYRLYGGTDLDVDAIGGVTPGPADTADPASPGVAVLEWPREGGPAGAVQIALRLGADANRDGPLRFDGAFAALFVTEISDGGFAGRWESGGGEHAAGGRFCAARTGGT